MFTDIASQAEQNKMKVNSFLAVSQKVMTEAISKNLRDFTVNFKIKRKEGDRSHFIIEAKIYE